MSEKNKREDQPALDHYMRIRQVLEIVPVSNPTWWRWVKAGIAPKPVKLGPQVTAWKESDIQAFLQRGDFPKNEGEQK